MPIYHYRGVDKNGAVVSGSMEARDDGLLEEKLRGIGYWLIKAEPEENQRTAILNIWGQVKRQDLIDFCTQMGAQIKAGVPLVQALEVCAEECENPRLKLALEAMLRNIEAGALFYEAVERHPDVFESHIASLVRAGELSGRLPDTFRELRVYLEWVERTVNDVRQASIYPTVVLTVVVVFILVLFTFVIPRFTRLLTGLNVPLPKITQMVFATSDFIKGSWWLWISMLLFGTVGLQFGRRASKKIAYYIDSVRLKAPGFGEINRMLCLTRFCQNLALMYRSGIPILQALFLCRGLVGNVVMEEAVRDVEQRVASGESMSEAVSRHAIFPSMVRRMVILGENTGNLDEALETAAGYYNEVIPRRIKRIFSIAEPMLMIGLVILVGTVATSIFLPLLSILTKLR